MASNSRAAVLSDVHIGNNGDTCWYQRKVHEPYLAAALEWIANNAEQFREVVLLGDLVDIWTYPPGAKPPSMADIISANPNILGSEGALAKVVKAVPKVTFLLGNHDGTLTEEDIATLQSSVGQIELVGPVHVLSGESGARTVFSHGHLWTMFNAPDEKSPWNTLPVGHFVTRAFSYMMANKLPPEKTVAEMPNMGYPDGFEILPFLRSLGPNMSPDLAAILLSYVATASEMPETLPIVLPNGESTTIADAKRIYADLFTRWTQKEGSVLNAARAALADGSGNYLAWFAQRLAIQQNADLVVFGHTHTPIGGLSISPINYFNSGFECASAPDNPPKMFNFTIVDLETAAAEIMMVEHGSYAISIAPVPALHSVVLPPAMDFSCYVRILNHGSVPLTLTQSSASEGYWAVPPTGTIPPGGRGDGWLQDYAGAHGSEGSFAYDQGGKSLPFTVSCPTGWWPNTASGAGGNFVARSGAGEWGSRGSVPSADHPLQVIFTVEGP
jgi:UDP-2,3-diacylglucosamine pyrophosphatase LpxH